MQDFWLKNTLFAKFCQQAGILSQIEEKIVQYKIGKLEYNKLMEFVENSLEMAEVSPELELEIVQKSENYTTIIGNGDVQSLSEIQQKTSQYGVDGVMVGRGIFKNPWLFNPKILDKEGVLYWENGELVSSQDKLNLLMQHLLLWEKTWGNNKNFAVMKKYFKIYVNGFDGAGELRARLMQTQNIDESLEILREFMVF